MSTELHVEFAGAVAAQLAGDFAAQFSQDLAAIGSQLCTNGPSATRVLVSRMFRGYTQDLRERIILGLEVQFEDHRYETHIVKIGFRDKIKKDYEGWIKCTSGRQVASRIFAPVQLIDSLGDDRVAVLYRDAYTLFGLDQEENRPNTLEFVAARAVSDDRPDPMSVERAIAHIYTDLSRWFFPGARSDSETAAAFYRRKLRIYEGSAGETLRRWREDADLLSLRRDAVWLICGRDKPDADPFAEPARYLDPVDFVDWTLDASAAGRLPDTLVGRSHGDLHGRNILLGVRRGETEYPAVFDYEDMSDDNVLVWDFVKLETELKIRLLPYLYDQDNRVRATLESRSSVPCVDASRSDPGRPTFAVERARRIAAFLSFEEMLHDATRRIHSRVQAERIQAFPDELCSGVRKLDRLLSILLRIRKEAALALGYERRGRIQQWMDEYYFALSVYGLVNVDWDYEPLQRECAVISAGVSASQMPSAPEILRQNVQACISGEIDAFPRFVSYRVPLFAAHHYWKQSENKTARDFLYRLVRQNIDLADVDSESKADGVEGTPLGEAISIEYQHAVPLVAEYALLETECGNSALAELLLESLRPQAAEFGDFETMGRIGRLFKDSGDRRWEQAGVSFRELDGTPAWQMYQKALRAYDEAYRATDDYYTGINAATLAALTGDLKKAQEYAARVAETCERLPDVARADRFWVFATEGEAAVLRGRWTEALNFYASALAELSPGQGGMADSAYKQLRRLERVFEESRDKMRPILDLFENNEEFRPFLSLDMFGKNEVHPPDGYAI